MSNHWFERLMKLLGLSSRETPPPAFESGAIQVEAPAGHAEDAIPQPAPVKALQPPAAEPTPTDDSNKNSITEAVSLVPAVEPVPTAPLDDLGRRQLRDIRKYSAWAGKDGEKLLQEVTVAFQKAYPGHEGEIEQSVAQGQADREINELAYKISSQKGRAAFELKEVRIKAKAQGIPSHILEKQIDRGDACYQRWTGARAARQSGEALSKVKPRGTATSPKAFPDHPLMPRRDMPPPPAGLHANDLRVLQPATQWQILIDETGDAFGPDAAHAQSRRLGRFVGLVLPATAALPSLSLKWHAVDCTDDREIDHVVQAVLNAEIGVLGICVTSLPVTPGERWADGVALLIDWILRLIPVSGPTRVEVLVENRGIFGAGQSWDLVARESLRHLALAFPQRAASLDLSISVIGKDGSAYNGYVDALAFTWAGTSDSSRERLVKSGLSGTCLFKQDARDLLNGWDAFAQGVELPSYKWWELVSSPDTQNSVSILGCFLDCVGEECRSDEARWVHFLDEARRRMAASPVDLRSLGSAVDWLQRFKPAGSTMPPLLRMAWLTVQLAHANHLGSAEAMLAEELGELSSSLIEEAAPLVCYADLHLAVACTNRFDFEGATKALEKWGGMSRAVPGLHYWGQAQSSLGQHAAFLGQISKASRYFELALDAFGHLSDPVVRDRETAQTACYRAIVLMDSEHCPQGEARLAVEKVTGPLREAVVRLASSSAPADRYMHHLLLRWIIQRHDAEASAAYLAQRSQWQTNQDHPWPLIQLYRGMLVLAESKSAARELALEGASIAFAHSQGPTVRMIGLCCRAISVSWGASWPTKDADIQAVRCALPFAANRIDALLAWLARPEKPLDLLKTVLPFNFR